MELKTLSVSCPTCKTQVLMTPAFEHRPFCCKRCQMIDFGEWVNEEHKIEGEPVIDPNEHNNDY